MLIDNASVNTKTNSLLTKYHLLINDCENLAVPRLHERHHLLIGSRFRGRGEEARALAPRWSLPGRGETLHGWRRSSASKPPGNRLEDRLRSPPQSVYRSEGDESAFAVPGRTVTVTS